MQDRYLSYLCHELRYLTRYLAPMSKVGKVPSRTIELPWELGYSSFQPGNQSYRFSSVCNYVLYNSDPDILFPFNFSSSSPTTTSLSSHSTFIIRLATSSANVFDQATSPKYSIQFQKLHRSAQPFHLTNLLQHRVPTSNTRLSMYSCSNAFRHHPPLTLQPFPIPRRPCSLYAKSNG